jgi:hypothetical protein
MAADWRYQHDPTSSGYAFERQINIEPLAFVSNKRESYSLRASPSVCQILHCKYCVSPTCKKDIMSKKSLT